jgi:Tfp pilus assembly protein PilF
MSKGVERKRNPSAQARRNLARAYHHEAREELQAALAECEAALRLAGDWAEAHNLHGIVLDGLGRESEALAAYAGALRLDPTFQEARENLAELEAELAREESPAPSLGGGSLDLEPASVEPIATLPDTPTLAPPSGRAPACDACGRSDETLREVLYPYVVSLLIFTFRRGFAGRWCRRHRDLRLGLASLITVTVGWLGIPWGLFYTPLALLHLARGGTRLEDSNVELLTDLAGHKLSAGKPKEAAACLEECLKYEERPKVVTSLRELYEVHGVAGSGPTAALAGSFLRVLLLSALMGGAIGLIDFAITVGPLALFEEGSFLLAIVSWIPFMVLLYFGGLVLARLVEGGLTRARCRHAGLASALGVLSALLVTYGVLQGAALGAALDGSGPGVSFHSLGDLLLTTGAILTSGGALTAASMLRSAGLVDLIYLGLLLVAGVYCLALGLSTAQSTARWQQRLATARMGLIPDRVPSASPGWAAVTGTVVVLVLLGVLFPHGHLAAEHRASALVEDGLAFLEAGDLEGATDNLEEAVRVKPDLPEAHYVLAWCYAFGGDATAAITEFEEVMRLDPARRRKGARGPGLGLPYSGGG